jgi:hypothetical protein
MIPWISNSSAQQLHNSDATPFPFPHFPPNTTSVSQPSDDFIFVAFISHRAALAALVEQVTQEKSQG